VIYHLLALLLMQQHINDKLVATTREREKKSSMNQIKISNKNNILKTSLNGTPTSL
jgi:hypothetical protein